MNKYAMEKRSVKSVTQTITKMAPAILTALVATGLGFLALYTSPVPMIQDFGKMLTVGMIVSFLIGLLFTVPIMYTRDRFFVSEKQQSGKSINKTANLETFLCRLTRKISSFKWLIIVLAFLTAGVGIWADLNIGVETDVENFMPPAIQELRDIHRLRDVLGTTDQVSVLYNEENVLSERVLNWVDNITQSLPEEFPSVIVKTQSITSVLRQANNSEGLNRAETGKLIDALPAGQLKLLVNEERSKGVIAVGIKHLEVEALQEFIQKLNMYLAANSPSGLQITVTGKAVLDVEMVSALTTGRYRMTLLGMAAVFLGLLLVYRNPIKAVIPLLPIILIIGWSGAAMYLVNFKYTPLTATLGALIIGIGTEFTILIMERFFEERTVAETSIQALSTAVGKVGPAIFASALTTMGGFSALLVSDFRILSNFGIMTLTNIFLALLSAIVVLPAVLLILDRFFKGNKEVAILETKVG